MMNFTLLKSNCVLCGAYVTGKLSLCNGCRQDLPRVESACRMCALPLVPGVETNMCGQCINQKSYVDYAINLFPYESPVDYLISEMKFQQQFSVTAVLADLLKEHIEKIVVTDAGSATSFYDLPDAILPIPLHRMRLAKRGFNQSLEIIKPFAKSQNIPVLLNCVERSKETKAQTNLNKQQRVKNVSGCFSLIEKPTQSHIVIIDDVVTTGATTKELAKVLKQSGVQKVGVWSLARAQLN